MTNLIFSRAFALGLLMLLGLSGLCQTPSRVVGQEVADEYLWLEEVAGEKQLDWVRERNQRTQDWLEQEATFQSLKADLLAILDSDARIPAVSKHGEWYYNFWRDRKNPRGLWRRTTWEEYRKDEPTWEVILDLDELAKAEGENWVWGGARFLRPANDRALISMSRGGADARVTREFDVPSRSFVEGGFELPESKGSMGWIDLDHVFVQTNFGEGSMTDSGYPRLAKRWRRGTPLESATLIYEGSSTDMSVMALHDDSPGFERDFVMRNLAFYNNEMYLLVDDQLHKIDLPNSANKRVAFEYLVVELREPWSVGGRNYPAGALLVGNFDKFMTGEREFDVVFEPSENSALAGYSFTKNFLMLNILEDVKNRLYVLPLRQDKWVRQPLVGAPQFGSVSAGAVDPDESDEYFMTSTDYLTPSTMFWGVVGEAPQPIKSTPAYFDATGMEIQQHFATSDDGTRVPYFVMIPAGMELNGANPTLLYGYGGFEISMLPRYNAAAGRAWVGEGGVYVVANIRGGGEYGPRWHQAALKQNRLRAYEDFAAVARDLFARKITSPEHLGIQGGSNGGLLVGNMVALYPEIMAAAVCQVPLLDMRRYNQLLAGASWMAEYGNPDIPEEWKFIQTFSPYHNVNADRQYPAVLFTTSTRDDRVHPGHARKMMALMESQGHEVWYYENIEGGHGGAANNEQSAFMQALAYTFLRLKLFPQSSTGSASAGN
ncbi:MAG: S9 family peptidase [Pirellulaceae bacterium]|nr:S9 family peptidase [Pirellulaceae bacterium]